MTTPYTRRQGEYLAFIHSYTTLHRQPPAEADIAAYFHVSPPTVHQMVVTLERRGLIQRRPGQARSLRVLLPPEALPRLDGGRAAPVEAPAFAVLYPNLANWVMGGGWVELGSTDYTPSMARALDEGGMVWEGEERYASMDELLRDLDQGIARWTEENL